MPGSATAWKFEGQVAQKIWDYAQGEVWDAIRPLVALGLAILSGLLGYTFMSFNMIMFRRKWPLGSIKRGYLGIAGPALCQLGRSWAASRPRRSRRRSSAP